MIYNFKHIHRLNNKPRGIKATRQKNFDMIFYKDK